MHVFELRLRLLPAVLWGLVLGSIGTSITAYFTAEDSLFFSRGDQAFFGFFVGGLAGAATGFLLWLVVLTLSFAVDRLSRSSG